MHFKSGFLYHVYNRGNNSGRIFFDHKNYVYFLEKIRHYIFPYCDIIAWCLMPNHFHFMVHVKYVIVEIPVGLKSDRKSPGHAQSKTKQITKPRTLNYSIGIMLRSYARAIQKQENFTGSLFQPKTKAACINCHKGITPAWFQTAFGAAISTSIPEKQYPKLCFDYIHQNPVAAGLVSEATDWEYSSASDYYAGRAGILVNRELTQEWGLV